MNNTKLKYSKTYQIQGIPTSDALTPVSEIGSGSNPGGAILLGDGKSEFG